MPKLTQTTAKALAPAERTFIAYDEHLVGFGCRVTPGGAKSWIVEYRPGGGRRSHTKRLTLGNIATLPADKARRAAQQHLAHARLGADPGAERSKHRAGLTIAELGERFLAEEVAPKRKARTTELYEGYLRLHVLPVLGTRKAREITHADIARLHRRIGAYGAKVTANRVVTFVSGLFTWAGKMGEVAKGTNPAKDVERFREEGRERHLNDDEIRLLGETLALAESVGLPYEIDEGGPKAKHARKPENRRTVISPHATNAIRLLLLTGCRLREILHLRWSNVDLAHALFTIVDGKTGRRVVWLNAPALAVLDTLAAIRIGDFVVAGDNADKPRADLQKPWAQIVKNAQLDGVTLHTLRHTHATVGVGAGLGLPLIGALLGHRQASTTQKYAHIAASPARRASEAIGAALAAAMGQPTHAAEIMPLRRRGRS